MSDVEGNKVVERPSLHVGIPRTSEQQRYQIPGNLLHISSYQGGTRGGRTSSTMHAK